MHRVGLRKIALDLSPGPLLRASQPERQLPDKRSGETARLFDRWLEHRSPARLAFEVVLAHGELLRQQLIEFHALPRRQRAGAKSRWIRSGTWVMQAVDGFAETAQAKSPAHVFGQRVIEPRASERVFDQGPQPSLRKSCRRRVDRRQRRRQRILSTQHAKARVDHLSAEKAGAHFTECAHLRTGLKRLGLTSKEIEEAQRQFTR